MKKIYDVIVVGAGPAGSSVAYFLAKSGINVLLLDKAEFPRDKTCGDGLTPRALKVLSEMEILGQVKKIGNEVNSLKIHGHYGDTISSGMSNNPGYPDHMIIAPRIKLDNLILKNTINSQVEYKSPIRVRSINEIDKTVIVKTSYKGKKIDFQSRLVVLAVGANMKLLQNLDILKYKPDLILGARGYFEGIDVNPNQTEAHFENVPLPGYGWVFPTSDTSANIGLVFWKSRNPWKTPRSSAINEMEKWLKTNKKIRNLTRNAKNVSPIKGYPLRVDFSTAPTYKGRILLVGEAAGLVSPFTGEGIDFALESGKYAAEYISSMFLNDDFSIQKLEGYDLMLRKHFQDLFVILARVRQIYLNPRVMKRYILASQKHPDLKDLVMRVMLTQVDPSELVNLKIIRKVLLGI